MGWELRYFGRSDPKLVNAHNGKLTSKRTDVYFVPLNAATDSAEDTALAAVNAKAPLNLLHDNASFGVKIRDDDGHVGSRIRTPC